MILIYLFRYFFFFKCPHLPKPQTHPLPNPHKRRENQIRFNPHIECQRFDAFVLEGAGAEDVGNFCGEAGGDLVVDAFGEGDDVAGQDFFQDAAAFGQAFGGGIAFEVLFVQGLPAVEGVVAVVVGRDAEGRAAQLHVGDVHRLGAAGEGQRPIGLGEEVLRFGDAVADENHGRAFVVLPVLDERVAVVVVFRTVGAVVVVVVDVFVEADFPDDGAPEGGGFIGGDFGVKDDFHDL